MKTLRLTFTTAALLSLVAFPSFSADKKKPKPLTASEIFKRSVPAIVAIDCLGENGTKIGTASGFLVAENGKIFTNLHVIAACQNLAVRLSNGDTYDSASVIAVDARKDLALIRIKAVSLPVLPMADSNEIEVGQVVYSIGNPKGLQNTLQQGLVGGFQQGNGYRLVQVSASLNPGNSGGPILDDQGRVIAVAAMKVNGAENLGFAIPINYAKGYLDTSTDTPFAAFAAAMKQVLTNAVKTAGSGAPDGVVGGVPGGIPSGAPGGNQGVVLGGIIGSVPSTAPTPPPPPRMTGTPQPAPTFTVIETIAGKDWKFTGDGMPALKAALGHCWGVACDRSGNIYATDNGNQAIVKIDPAGLLHILASPDSAPQNRPSSPLGIAVDSAGVVYFVENGQRVRKILPGGEVVLFAGNDKSGFSPDGSVAAGSSLNNITGLAIAPGGSIVFSEGSNNRVRRVDAQGRLETVAGDGQGQFSGDNGPAENASLQHPSGLAYDAQGSLFIVDQNNARVRKVTPDGKIGTIIGPGVTTLVPRCPTAVAVNSKGDVFVADPCKRQILMLRNGETSIFGGTGTGGKEPSGQGGPATAASFDEWALAVNEKDDLLVSGPDYGYVYRIGRDGIFSIVAGSGNWRAPADGTMARDAWFQRLSHIAVDAKGSMFVTDFQAHRIYRIDPQGAVTQLAGTARGYYGGENVVAKDAGISQPLGVRVRSTGSIVFSERGNSRIREITPDGKLRTLAGNGRSEYAGDGGRATSAALNAPSGIAIDASGTVYFADTGNQRIRKVTADGNIQLVAGNGTRGYSGDGGPAERASLNMPAGVEVGPDGSIYIADAGNHRVRRVSNGTITTVAGDGTDRLAGDGGPAEKASLGWPYELAFGPERALYILDTNAVRVRRVDPVSGVITTVAGNGARTNTGDGGPPLQAGLAGAEGLAIDATGNLFIAENSGRIRAVRAAPVAAGTASGAASPALRQFTPPRPALSGSADAAIQVSVDRMETFLRGKVAVWTQEEAKTVLGAVKEEHREQSGISLTFETPGTSFLNVTLAFGANGKLANVTFYPSQLLKWDRQLAYMKTTFAGDEFKAEQSGDNTIYTFSRSRTSFVVQPDGTIEAMSIF